MGHSHDVIHRLSKGPLPAKNPRKGEGAKIIFFRPEWEKGCDVRGGTFKDGLKVWVYWVAVKEPNLTYYIGETILVNIPLCLTVRFKNSHILEWILGPNGPIKEPIAILGRDNSSPRGSFCLASSLSAKVHKP